MKKIALLTWYDNENYGTALQAYALEKSIGQFAPCEIIQYRTKFPGYNINHFTDPVLRKNLIYKVYDRTVMKFYKKYYENEESKRRLKMEEYFKRYLVFHPGKFDSENLKILNNEFEIFVCGSDQIWNPISFDPMFFLSFVDDKNKKIAYAPSFGVSSIREKGKKHIMSKLLNRFDAISVREVMGKKIVKDIIGDKCEVCLDPTLLLEKDEWEKIANDSTADLPEEYIFTYLLGRGKKNLKKAKRISKTLGKKLLVQPYYLPDYVNGEKKMDPSGPEDFLKAIRDSSFVCTDSFHGAIFAIIFKKPFVLFSRFNSKNKSSQNSRVESLMELVGLKERLDFKELDSKSSLLKISFDMSDELLKKERKKSLEYLCNAIKG